MHQRSNFRKKKKIAHNQQIKKRKEIDLFEEDDENNKVIDLEDLEDGDDDSYSDDEEISNTLFNKPVQDPIKFMQHGTLEEELRDSLKILSLSSVKEDKLLGDWEKHTRGVGSKLLLSMGYKMGTGLGASGDGIVKPLNLANAQRGVHGLGFEKETKNKSKRRKKESREPTKNEGTVFTFLNRINNTPHEIIKTDMRGIWFYA